MRNDHTSNIYKALLVRLLAILYTSLGSTSKEGHILITGSVITAHQVYSDMRREKRVPFGERLSSTLTIL